MKIAGDDLRLDVEHATADARIVSSRKRMVSRSSRSPICCETKASRPRVTVTVVLRSPPRGEHARAVGAEVDRLGHEAARAPQKGRSAVDRSRITRSSARTTISRSWVTIRSAMPAEFSARLVVVDDQRLAAGIGAGRDEREIGRRVAPGAIPAPAARGTAVEGRIGEHHADVAQSGATLGASRPGFGRARSAGPAIEQRALGRPSFGEARGAREVRRP